MFASEHTRLINRFIGLCIKTTKWPSILHDVGYKVQLIEQSISLKTAKKIKPDVIAVSNKHLHALVTDCKSGKNIDLEQNKKYEQLTPKDLSYFVTVHDYDRLTHSFCYIDKEINHSELKENTKFPFITFGDNVLEGEGGFGSNDVDKALCQKISLNGMVEPVSFYPFSPDDQPEVIAPHVLRGIVSYYAKKGINSRINLADPAIANHILPLIHPFYKTIESDHRERLTKTIFEMLTIFIRNDNFKEPIEKIERGEATVATFQSLAKVCESMAEEYSKQQKITDYSP